MRSARYELEKRKLELKLKEREQGLFSGITGAFFSALKSSSNSNGTDWNELTSKGANIIGKLADAVDDNSAETLKNIASKELESKDLNSIVKLASLLGGKRSSMGMVVLGSIIGGVWAAQRFLGKTTPEE